MGYRLGGVRGPAVRHARRQTALVLAAAHPVWVVLMIIDRLTILTGLGTIVLAVAYLVVSW